MYKVSRIDYVIQWQKTSDLEMKMLRLNIDYWIQKIFKVDNQIVENLRASVMPQINFYILVIKKPKKSTINQLTDRFKIHVLCQDWWERKISYFIWKFISKFFLNHWWQMQGQNLKI